MMKAKDLREEARESLKGHRGKAGGTYLAYLLVSMLLGVVLYFIPSIGPILSLLITSGILYGCITVLMRIKRNEEVSAFDCVGEGFSKFWKVFCVNLWVCLKLLPWIVMFIASIILSWLGHFNNNMYDRIEYNVELSNLEFDLEHSTSNDEIERLEQEIAQLKEKGEPKDNSEIYYIISLVLMVTGLAMSIIRGFRYSLTNFLIFDNPDMKAKEIVNKSAELMKGNVGRIFRLNLSFIGWFVLVYIGIIISGSIMMFGSLPFGDFTVITLLGLVGYIATLFVMVFFLTPYIQMANICFYEELVGTRDEVIDDTENAIM